MIGFLKFTWLYILISAVIIGSGLYSMARYGFTYSIDFIGGSIIEYQFDKKTDLRKINDIIKRNKIETAQTKFEKSNLSFKTKPLNEKQEVKLRSELETELKLKIKLQRFETVGPVIGRETMQKTDRKSVV